MPGVPDWGVWCLSATCCRTCEGHSGMKAGVVRMFQVVAPSSQWPSRTEATYSWSLVNNTRKMCTVPSTPVSLGRPLSSPSCSACLPFCSLFNLPHHFCRIFMHSHAFTHTHALASSLPQCVLHFPTHQCYLRGTFLQALTHSHSCTCSPTQTHTHTHTNFNMIFKRG